MLHNVIQRFNVLPAAIKIVLVLAALALLVLASPFTVVLAVLFLLVSVFALLIRVIRRRPLRSWGLAAAASFVAILVFTGTTNALYGSSAPQKDAGIQSAAAPETTVEPTGTEQATTEPPAPPKIQREETIEETTQAQEPTQEAEPVTLKSAAPSTSACPPVDQVLNGVYHPERLEVLDPCLEASGTVAKVLHEKDGDLHIRLTLDDQYKSLLSEGNDSKQHGDLVVEYMARDGGHLTEPKTGDHLDVVGAWVTDIDHDWNEIHPVFSASLNGEPEEASGSQFGGSPTSDRSSNAAADCRTETAQVCVGYGRGTDSSDEPSGSEADKGASPQPSPQPVPAPKPAPAVPPAPAPDIPPAPAQPSVSNGADCSTGVHNVPVVPGSKGDRDKDGIACES